MYCVSPTLIDSFGGTKKKSKQATARNAAHAPAPRPQRNATPTTVSRNNITTFARSNTRSNTDATAVAAKQASVAHRYGSHLMRGIRGLRENAGACLRAPC